MAFQLVARDALHGFRAPVGAHVRKDVGLSGEQVAEEEAGSVQGVVFRGEGHRRARAVPVKGGVEQGFRNVSVRVEVRPVALALEAAGNGLVAHGFLFAVDFLELGVALHHVPEDHGHQHAFLEGPAASGFVQLQVRAVLVFGEFEDGVRPLHGEVEFRFVVNLLVHAAAHFRHVHGLYADAQVVFPEGLVHDGAGDAHGAAADGEVALAAEGGYGQAGAAEAQDFFSHVFRNGGIPGVLDVFPVNGEGGEALLVQSGQGGGQVHGAGAFRAVEAPDGFGRERVHVKGLAAVAPAGRDGQGDADVVGLEFVRAGGGFRRTANAGVCDHALDGFAGGVADVGLNESRGRLGHVHGLIFQGFPDAEAAAVNRGADTDGW